MHLLQLLSHFRRKTFQTCVGAARAQHESVWQCQGFCNAHSSDRFSVSDMAGLNAVGHALSMDGKQRQLRQ